VDQSGIRKVRRHIISRPAQAVNFAGSGDCVFCTRNKVNSPELADAGPPGIPIYSVSGEATNAGLAAKGMSAAHAEARPKSREYAISKGLLLED